MSKRLLPLLPLGLLAAVLATGCGSSQATDATQAPAKASPSTSASAGQMNGMDMAGTDSAGAPSATAKMVCGPEIKGQVKKVLSLPGQPTTSATWVDTMYTCTYYLPQGHMIVSVKQSSSDAAAVSYFNGHRASLGRTQTMIGLGTLSYGTGDGIVVVVKDDKTLQVDTTALPKVFGTNGQRRSDLAYEIASDVMGCWTGSSYDGG